MTINVQKNGKVFIQGTEVAWSELAAKLRAIAAAGYNGAIFLNADKSDDYGTLMRAISEIRKGGVTKVVLVTASAP